MRILGLVTMLLVGVTLSGCETTRGFVQDAKNVGDALLGN